MRIKCIPQRYLDFTFDINATKEVRRYRERYAKLNEVLLKNPEILECAHKDFCSALSSSDGGRASRYTSEEIVRTMLVFFIEGDAYRDLVIRIDNSDFLRSFIGLGIFKPMMDYSFVAKAFSAMSEDTWLRINDALARYASAEGLITAARLRMDSTVYEANIHYPTDSSLLWDSYRVLVRSIRFLQQEAPGLGLGHRFHDKKVKKAAQYIARNAGSSKKGTQREVKRMYRRLFEQVRRVAALGADILERLPGIAACYVPELESNLPIVAQIIDQAERRVLHGEKVPASEKVYSLFEPHTEMLVRGKAGKPVEFGHKVFLAQTGEKFIHHYQVLEQRREDPSLLPDALNAHEQLFGSFPELCATDKGFYESKEQREKLSKQIDVVSMCKKGRRTVTEEAFEKSASFQEGQRFRAGVEGTISVLKRAFKLKRCFFKGFKNFAASVGAAVFCHNLLLLARQ